MSECCWTVMRLNVFMKFDDRRTFSTGTTKYIGSPLRFVDQSSTYDRCCRYARLEVINYKYRANFAFSIQVFLQHLKSWRRKSAISHADLTN